MQDNFASWLSHQGQSVLSVLDNAFTVTFRPSAFPDRIRLGEGASFHNAINFFIACVGATIAVEAVFSFVFDTSYSDFIHYFFPIFVAMTGALSIYAILKIIFTKNLSFTDLAHCSFYVFGAALLFTVAIVLAMISLDFIVHRELIAQSSCKYRTIMCLLSHAADPAAKEGYGYEYEYGYGVRPGWTLGLSLIPAYLFVFVSALYYARVLSIVLKKKLDVARWRTCAAALVTLIVLTPSYFAIINAIYAAAYAR